MVSLDVFLQSFLSGKLLWAKIAIKQNVLVVSYDVAIQVLFLIKSFMTLGAIEFSLQNNNF
jgi:hypothetical protein